MLTGVINASSSGDNTLLAANANARIRVHAYVIVAAGAVSVTFKSGGSTLTGAMPLAANGGVSSPSAIPTPVEQLACLFFTAKNEALVLNLSGAVAVTGHFSYTLEPA